MNILGIVGSGKVDGNTERFLDACLKGAAEQGHSIYKIHLGKTKIAPCMGCNVCQNGNGCIQDDGMNEFLKAFRKCDAIVFATPLYFWGISAQMKAVIDRMYSIGEKDPKGYFRYPNKKCGCLITAADSDRHFWTFELAEQYYRRLVHYLRWTDIGILTAGNCGGTSEARCIEETNHLVRAYEFGRKFGKSAGYEEKNRKITEESK